MVRPDIHHQGGSHRRPRPHPRVALPPNAKGGGWRDSNARRSVNWPDLAFDDCEPKANWVRIGAALVPRHGNASLSG